MLRVSLSGFLSLLSSDNLAISGPGRAVNRQQVMIEDTGVTIAHACNA